MRRRIYSQFLLLGTAIFGASCGPVNPFHPNVAEGGRVVSIAVKPGDDQRILVASETGGLFRTDNGGTTWQHVNGLQNYFITDVAFAPGSPNIVIVAAQALFGVYDGGVWKSTDDGKTWSQPPSSIPQGSRCRFRAGAYSVSFEPGTNNVYVGTDCGLAASKDLGATWTHLVLDPMISINNDQTQDRVWSVLAQNGGRVILAVENGLWFSTDSGASWQKAASQPTDRSWWTIHGLAASPFDSRHIFHARDSFKLYLSTDGGANWSLIGSPQPGLANRNPFVRVAKSVSGKPDQFDVYFGNGINLFRQTFTHAPSGPSGSGNWKQLIVDHPDPADIAFDNPGR